MFIVRYMHIHTLLHLFRLPSHWSIPLPHTYTICPEPAEHRPTGTLCLGSGWPWGSLTMHEQSHDELLLGPRTRLVASRNIVMPRCGAWNAMSATQTRRLEPFTMLGDIEETSYTTTLCRVTVGVRCLVMPNPRGVG